MKVFSDGIAASGYLMPLAKILELLCGLSFVTGKFTKLFGIVLLPITVNIFFINVNLMPDEVVIAGALLLSNLFIIYTFITGYFLYKKMNISSFNFNKFSTNTIALLNCILRFKKSIYLRKF